MRGRTNACNGAVGPVGFETNASRAGPLMRDVRRFKIACYTIACPFRARLMESPDHPILDQPWEWQIEEFSWHTDQIAKLTVLDVRFVRNGQHRILRFTDPRDVTIQFDGGYPIQCGEMAIRDISRRQLEGLSVCVTESGASGAPLRLYARSVHEISR